MPNDFIERLKSNDSSLTHLDLSNADIGDDGAKAIAEALKTNSSLTHLYLKGNCIGPAGAKAIAEALKTNSSIVYLDMRENCIGPAGAKAIAEALKVNLSLTYLILFQNGMHDSGARELDKAITNNVFICCAYYNKMSAEVWGLLRARQEKMQSLIDQYKAGTANTLELIDFLKQIECIAEAYGMMKADEINEFYLYIKKLIAPEFAKQLPQDHGLKTVIEDVALNNVQNLSSADLQNLAMTLFPDSLKAKAQKQAEEVLKAQEEERKAQEEADRAEEEWRKAQEVARKAQEEQRKAQEVARKEADARESRNNLLKSLCGGVVSSYATYKLATTMFSEYIGESSVVYASVIVCAAAAYGINKALIEKSSIYQTHE